MEGAGRSDTCFLAGPRQPLGWVKPLGCGPRLCATGKPPCLGPVVVGRGERGKRWPFGAVARGLGIRTGGGGGAPLPRHGGERMAKARSKGDPRRAGEAVSVADGAGVWEGGGR